MRRIFLTLPCACAIFLLGACATRQSSAPVPGPQSVSLSQQERRAIADRLRARSREIETLRALFRTAIFEADSTSHLRHAVAFRLPSEFRLEALPTSGALSLSLIVGQPEGAILLVPNERRAVKAASASALLQSMLRIPVRSDDLMYFITGRVPERFIARLFEEGARVWRDGGEQGSVFAASADQKISVELDMQSFLLRWAEVKSAIDDEAAYRLSFSNPLNIAGQDIAAGVEFSLPKHNVRIGFEVSQARINVPVPDSVFRVSVPADWTVREPE